MADNYLERYKEEDSVSSGSGEDGVEVIKRGIAAQKAAPSAEPKQEPQLVSKPPERKPKEDDKVSLYTFDPRSVLDSASGSSKGYASMKSLEMPSTKYTPSLRDYDYGSTRTPRDTTYGSSIVSRYAAGSNLPQYKKDLDFPQIGKGDLLKNLQYDLDEPGFMDPKSENDYRAIAKEFDNEFGERQRSIADVSRQLVTRIKRLQTLGRDLSAPNADMSLLRTRLFHELETTQSDLNDANNGFALLLKDRDSIKDKYCYLKLRNKELKNFTKVFQENIRS